MSIHQLYEKANIAFKTGKVLTDDNDELINHLSGLANQNAINESHRSRDIIRGITINHILMQRHIDDLNKQNSKTQKLVIVLALIAAISSIVQITLAIFPEQTTDKKLTPIESVQQKQEQAKEPPSQVSPQKTNPALKKSP